MSSGIWERGLTPQLKNSYSEPRSIWKRQQPISNIPNKLKDENLNELLKNLTIEKIKSGKYIPGGRKKNYLNNIKNFKDKEELNKYLEENEINIEGLNLTDKLSIESKQIDVNSIIEKKENKIEEEINSKSNGNNYSASSNNNEDMSEEITNRESEIVNNFETYINSNTNKLENFDNEKYRELILDMINKMEKKHNENVSYCKENGKPVPTRDNFLESRQSQCIMSYYKKLILDDDNFDKFIDEKFITECPEKDHFSEYISIIKGMINEQSGTQIGSPKKISIDLFFDKINDKNNGKLLYFLSGKEPNPNVESLINDFYPNENIYNILWGIAAYNKNFKIVSINDLGFHIDFFESSYDQLSKLIKKNDNLSKILFTTIKNLLIESSYRANHLEYHKNEIVVNNDSFDKGVSKLFQKCEIVTFFKCIDCESDLISIHQSYGDGLCTTCQKKYEEKLLSVESNIITGGEVDQETLYEITANKPHLLLNYPHKGKRVPIFIKDTDYDIEEGDKNSYSNLTKTSIVLKDNILDSDSKIKDEIVQDNKNEEYQQKINELKNYESSNLINMIGRILLITIREKSKNNRIIYDYDSYKNYDGVVNSYTEFIQRIEKYNIMDLVIIFYENKDKMDTNSKTRYHKLEKNIPKHCR